MAAPTKGYGIVNIKFQLRLLMKRVDMMDLQIHFLAATSA